MSILECSDKGLPTTFPNMASPPYWCCDLFKLRENKIHPTEPHQGAIVYLKIVDPDLRSYRVDVPACMSDSDVRTTKNMFKHSF